MKRRPPTVVPTTRETGEAPATTASSTPSRVRTAIPVGCRSSPAPTGPGCGARSSTSTDAPSRAKNAAAASPAVPAPTTPTRRHVGAVRLLGGMRERAKDNVRLIASIFTSTAATSASTQEIAASAQTLAGTAEQLDALVGRFTPAH